MNKSSITQNKKKLMSVNELEGLEAQNRVQKHEQLLKMKPCVTAYLDGLVWPEPGERSKRFYALAAEYRRLGLSEETTQTKIIGYFNKVPSEILNTPGQDGQGFTLKEAENAVKAVFKGQKIKSYGCYSGMWDQSCIGDMCQFRKDLTGKSGQSFETAFFSFLIHWMNAKDGSKKLLFDSDIKIYIALMVTERLRDMKPGNTLFVSWQELSKISGVPRSKVGLSLENLFWVGLIAYQKGKQRGIASEIHRVIPIPKPPTSHLK